LVKDKTVVMCAPPRPNNTDDEADENQSVEDIIGKIKILIAPNPTKGFLQIYFENKPPELPVNYRISEMNGKFITSGKSTDNPLLLDFGSFAPGAYLLRLTIENKTETYKIIRQ